jgi:molybdopterin-guanine dinucleotide biosynthesis protein A
MQTAGFVLAGGASSRMGRNKALLATGGRTLLEIAAEAVREAAGSVTIIGPPDLYGHFGFPVIPDGRDHTGPLAGIETALRQASADWNLIVACDMPRLYPGALRHILDEAERLDAAAADIGCVMPESAEGFPEPLCAAYHKRVSSLVSAALDRGTRKVVAALPSHLIHYIRMTNDPVFQNVNTPEEWRLVQERH